MKEFIDIKTKINYSSILLSYPGLKELKLNDLKLKGNYNSYMVQDENRRTFTRSNVIFEVFPKETKKGMKISDFITKLKTWTWLEKKNFDIVLTMRGLIPIKMVSGNTVAVVRFANFPPHSIALYFRISEEAKKDELFFYLNSQQPMESAISPKKFKVVEAALFMEVGER